MYAEPQQPDAIDISNDTRPWCQVCPDNYLSLEYVGSRELTLYIVAVRQEKIGDKMKAVLRFSNEPRGLVINPTNRSTLVKLYGDSPASVINKWITVGLGFVNRNPALLIRDRIPATAAPPANPPAPTVPAGPATAAAPGSPPGWTPEQLAQFQQWQQAQQAATAGGAPAPTFPGAVPHAAG